MNPIQHSLSRVTAPEETKRRVKDYLSVEAARRGRGRSNLPRLIAACACLFLLLGLSGWQVWSVPVSYISIDVNPSIELALNRFDRVVGTTAYNGDGAKVLNGLAVQGRTYGDAIDALFADPVFQSYLDSEATVVFTVVSNSEAHLRQGIQNGSAFLTYDSEYFRADTHCLEEAHEHGLSVGKYRVYEELSYYNSSVTVEDCHDMTIGELQQELYRCSGHGSGHDVQEEHHSGVSTQPEAKPSPSAPQGPSPSPIISPSPSPSPGTGTSVVPEQGYGDHGHGHGHH